MNKERNIAFVDGQNLHLGTKDDGWKIDFNKLRLYLRDKYHVSEAYYFLGYISEIEQDLYNNIQKAGFIITFKEHISTLKGTKKGNVDTDVVFEVMRNLIDNKEFEKVLLVSGDGDYKKLVNYLVSKNKFKKILFPNKKASSLYKNLGSEFFDYLKNAKSRIEYHVNEKGS